ncbi:MULTISPECIES: hypothetical protein [unclassified Roseitalea]|uniref:hypothetical protein n=1 Tax=unclassified Roseitalea TaxID=2639107 RepID=UPI00273F7D43|nr:MULTISPECIES: hypothetical protein [unclassified Roseitalea]
MFVDIILRVPVPRTPSARPSGDTLRFAARAVLAAVAVAGVIAGLLMPLLTADPASRGQSAGRSVPPACAPKGESMRRDGGFRRDAYHLCVH